jgi:hypothetical protein
MKRNNMERKYHIIKTIVENITIFIFEMVMFPHNSYMWSRYKLTGKNCYNIEDIKFIGGELISHTEKHEWCSSDDEMYEKYKDVTAMKKIYPKLLWIVMHGEKHNSYKNV